MTYDEHMDLEVGGKYVSVYCQQEEASGKCTQCGANTVLKYTISEIWDENGVDLSDWWKVRAEKILNRDAVCEDCHYDDV